MSNDDDRPRQAGHDGVRDAGLDRAYGEASAGEPGPPPSLDAAIQAAARRAVNAGPTAKPMPKRSRWQAPLALAATVALAVGIAIKVQDTGEGDIARAPQPARSAEKVRESTEASAPAATTAPAAPTAPAASSLAGEPKADAPRRAAPDLSADEAKTEARAKATGPSENVAAPAQPPVIAQTPAASREREAAATSSTAPPPPAPQPPSTVASAPPAPAPSAGAAPPAASAPAPAPAPPAAAPSTPATPAAPSAGPPPAAAPAPAAPRAPAAAPMPELARRDAARAEGTASDSLEQRRQARTLDDRQITLRRLEGRPADEWIAEMRRLVTAGRPDDARALVDDFRRAFPDVALPDDLRSIAERRP